MLHTILIEFWTSEWDSYKQKILQFKTSAGNYAKFPLRCTYQLGMLLVSGDCICEGETNAFLSLYMHLALLLQTQEATQYNIFLKIRIKQKQQKFVIIKFYLKNSQVQINYHFQQISNCFVINAQLQKS